MTNRDLMQVWPIILIIYKSYDMRDNAYPLVNQVYPYFKGLQEKRGKIWERLEGDEAYNADQELLDKSIDIHYDIITLPIINSAFLSTAEMESLKLFIKFTGGESNDTESSN